MAAVSDFKVDRTFKGKLSSDQSINLKLTRKFEDFEYNSPLNCYLFEITEDWNENVINSNNEPDYNILPVKYFKIPILGDNESFLLDIIDILDKKRRRYTPKYQKWVDSMFLEIRNEIRGVVKF